MARWKALPEIIAKRQPSRSRTGKSQGPAQALVEIRIDFQGGYELHYVFAGSELEKYWRAKAAQAAEKTKNP